MSYGLEREFLLKQVPSQQTVSDATDVSYYWLIRHWTGTALRSRSRSRTRHETGIWQRAGLERRARKNHEYGSTKESQRLTPIKQRVSAVRACGVVVGVESGVTLTVVRTYMICASIGAIWERILPKFNLHVFCSYVIIKLDNIGSVITPLVAGAW